VIPRTNLAVTLPPRGVELWHHRVALVLRFVDPFVDAAPPIPPFLRAAVPDRVRVRIEALDWEARFSPSDGTYRFSVANADPRIDWHGAVVFGNPRPPAYPVVPVPLSVEITAPDPTSARYFVPTPLPVLLPVPGPIATPQQQLDAYLQEIEAFPTPLFRAPGGETCVRGVVRDGAGAPRAGVEVGLSDSLASPPAVFTRTGPNGFFASRLPWLRRPSPVPPSPSLGVVVRPVGGSPLAVVADPHPAGDPTRATFAHGLTTTVTIRAT
jgi:hypothetical protein